MSITNHLNNQRFFETQVAEGRPQGDCEVFGSNFIHLDPAASQTADFVGLGTWCTWYDVDANLFKTENTQNRTFTESFSHIISTDVQVTQADLDELYLYPEDIQRMWFDKTVLGTYSFNKSNILSILFGCEGESADTLGVGSEVRDYAVPVITMIGSDVELSPDDPYADLGAIALARTGDVSNEIIVDSDVDTSTEGDYTVTYNYTDAYGVPAVEVVRSVVVAGLPTEAVLEQRIDNPTPVASDNLGWSSSIFGYGDEATYVTGIWSEDTVSGGAGAVNVYTRSGATWTLEEVIAGTIASGRFGWSVSIAGTGDDATLVVGAYVYDKAYVYTRSGTTWTLEQEITGASASRFGHSVSVIGTGDDCTFIAGAYNRDVGGTDTGSAYVYTRSGTTWTLEQQIDNPAPVDNDEFSRSVSISGIGDDSVVAIGCANYDGGDTNEGAAYVYTRSGTTWTLEQEINSPSPGGGYIFGYTVAITGTGDDCALIVGGYSADKNASNGGSASVFTRTGKTWTLEQELIPPDLASSDYFGWSVSITNNICSIGGTLNDKGWIYTRESGVWSLMEFIQGPANSQFGASTAINKENVVFGADRGDIGAADAGNAYIYRLQ